MPFLNPIIKVYRSKHVLIFLALFLIYLPLNAQSVENIEQNELNSQGFDKQGDERDTKTSVKRQLILYDKGKPTWALILGGMMTTGGIVMTASNGHFDDSDDHHHSDRMSDKASIAMGTVGIGLLIYYFLSKDEDQKIKLSKDYKETQENLRFSVGTVKDTLIASVTWRW